MIKFIVSVFIGIELIAVLSLNAQTASTSDPVGPKGPIPIGVVIHLESMGAYGSEGYKKGIKDLKELLACAEKYNVKLTFEAALNVPEADEDSWYFNGTELFDDFELSGHGLGLHADLCGNWGAKGTGDCENGATMGDKLSDLKSALQTACDCEITHVSGICSYLNWSRAVDRAGFEFVSGVIDFCRTSLNKSSPLFLDAVDCPTPNDCHTPYPNTIPEVAHPCLLNSKRRILNWTHKCIGKSICSFGVLPTLGELKRMDGNVELDFSRDTEFLYLQIDEIIAHREITEREGNLHFDCITFKITPGILSLTQIEELFEHIHDEYIMSDKLKWRTFANIYEDYYESR